MTVKIREQILQIRSTGLCNMFSVYEVQRLAFEREFFELVLYLEDSRDEYVRFILYGDTAVSMADADETPGKTEEDKAFEMPEKAESEENNEI